MITRLSAHNYKCLVGFDLQLERRQLLLGLNGSGKSAALEVVARLVRLQRGEASIGELFPPSTLTRWGVGTTDGKHIQTFGLDVRLADGEYRYRLELDHDPAKGLCRIQAETLQLCGKNLFACEGAKAQLYRDDGSPGPQVLTDWTRSSLPLIQPRKDNQKLTRFRDWFRRLAVIRIDPRTMSARTEREEEFPREDLSNLASWWRHLWLERSDRMMESRDALRKILPGFQSLHLTAEGDARLLKATWARPAEGSGGSGAWPVVSEQGGAVQYLLDELSDGQRVLIGLATLIFALGTEPATLCLDEPDNFVALREIQPLLAILDDRPHIQLLAASHHPEVINLLARDHGLVFERKDGGPARVRKFDVSSDTMLTPAEVVARGEE